MTVSQPQRNLDALSIPEGYFTELYTPVAGRIKSVALGNKSLQAAKVFMSAAGTLTYKDYMGNQITAFSFPAGPLPFLVTEITAASVPILIVHNGVLWTGDNSTAGMTDDIRRY